VWLTASIGLAAYPADGDDAQALLESAEAAMQAARQLGGNCYRFYAPAQNVRIEDRLALIGDLHCALEQEQFVVYYQPQTDLATMRVVGCEALMRWQHPERGLVSPATFIPLAEESGFMQPIGEWVLRQACTQAAAWEREFHNQLRVGVNLSARQFQHSGLIEAVASALDEAGLPARLLELEVTETAILADPEAAASILGEVAKMGISIALDDFGTGYSSLSHLRQLPIDRLKIDRSFVSRLPDDADDCAIAAAVIDMARNLGLRVIAEGVETRQQVTFLRDRGCHEVQGYLFGKPVPAQSFTLPPAGETVRVGVARKS
jgi:EAL domain-containing protein (putative c-di-GMP-specific phosphodiesterase class I)